MDWSSLATTAASLKTLPAHAYPLFDACHVLLCVLSVRKDVGGRDFALKHPLAVWVACIVASFAGSILANPLLGKPMFGAFSDERMLLLASAFYLAVFFAPGDIFYKLVHLTPVYAAICVVKEIYRAAKILNGLSDGRKAFPNSPYFIPVVTAVLKGNGSAFAAVFTRAITGIWKPAETELMKPSVTTKECIMAAVFMAAVVDETGFLYVSLVGLFVTVKLSTVFGQSVDPFAPIEAIVFGLLGQAQATN